MGITTIVLVGGLTDVCVHYTFVDGHQRDYFVRVVTDCVGGSSTTAHDAALNAMTLPAARRLGHQRRPARPTLTAAAS